VRARRGHRLLHARDVESQGGRGGGRSSRSTTELAIWPPKGSAFWKTVPVILEGQALPTPGGAPLRARRAHHRRVSAAAAAPASRTSSAPTPLSAR
jgi:hypothetical protein